MLSTVQYDYNSNYCSVSITVTIGGYKKFRLLKTNFN